MGRSWTLRARLDVKFDSHAVLKPEPFGDLTEVNEDVLAVIRSHKPEALVLVPPFDVSAHALSPFYVCRLLDCPLFQARSTARRSISPSAHHVRCRGSQLIDT
jgi:hypothetical protein